MSNTFLYLLSLLVQLRPARQADFEETIKEFSAKLSLVPLPPPGRLHVVRNSFSLLFTEILHHFHHPPYLTANLIFNMCFSVHQSFTLRPLQVVLSSREDQDSPVIDIDLHLPFLCFSHTALLQVMQKWVMHCI